MQLCPQLDGMKSHCVGKEAWKGDFWPQQDKKHDCGHAKGLLLDSKLTGPAWVQGFDRKTEVGWAQIFKKPKFQTKDFGNDT